MTTTASWRSAVPLPAWLPAHTSIALTAVYQAPAHCNVHIFAKQPACQASLWPHAGCKQPVRYCHAHACCSVRTSHWPREEMASHPTGCSRWGTGCNAVLPLGVTGTLCWQGRIGARPPFKVFTACSIVQALQMGTVPVYIWKYTLVGRHSAREIGAAVKGAICNICLLVT